MNVIDKPREFRNALGSFATGITVVTAAGSDGAPLGMTVNSFASVSLAPPLVLWSIGKGSKKLAAYTDAKHYSIHVLSSDQQSLSNRFASGENNQFDGIDWHQDANGVPILNDFLCRFDCVTSAHHEGGDHIIIVGEVVEFEARDGEPLVFQGGSYRLLQDI